ncbi:MAG TPA: hypothetical protein VFU13_19680 [Steroidobacteraceae bacterium]|nr:hypothetical protein [Steroidobacteraceae bacterium]
MTRKLEIEANLDRSLANQVKAPRLDRRFDAAVWARIEAAEQRATNPVPERVKPPSSARWLFVINVIGVAIAALLVLIFGLQSFTEVSVNVPMPEVSAVTGEKILRVAAPAITLASLLFGLLFTPLGRRLRAELT